MPNRQVKIVICGNYGARNFGDEAILDGILYDLKKVIPQAHIIVLSTDPKHTSASHNIISLPLLPTGIRSFIYSIIKNTLSKTIYAISNADIFILGGGTLLSDEKFFSIFLWSIHSKTAQFFKTPVFIYANGIDQLKTVIGRWIVKKILYKCKIITVRDYNSLKIVKQLAMSKRVILTADPAFNLEEYQEQLPKFKNKKIIGKYIVVTYRNWDAITERKAPILARFLDIISDQYKLQIVLLPFQNYREKDIFILNKIFDQSKNKKFIHIIQSHHYIEAFNIIKDAEMIVGLRLHSIIFAVITQTPFIALSYTNKISGFLKTLGLEKYIIRKEEITESALFKLFQTVINEKKHIKKVLLNKKNEQIKKASQNRLMLKMLLDKI